MQGFVAKPLSTNLRCGPVGFGLLRLEALVWADSPEA